MIYLKRFCFAIISFICIFIGVIGTLLQCTTLPIWGLFQYVFTGIDPCEGDNFNIIWRYSMKFLDWYHNKFGPK